MTYLINEIFYSIQGEGYWAGRPAVFCRFSRCNLWTGHERDRQRAICKFCDTNFLAATPYTLPDLVRAITALWPVPQHEARFIVLTGGEPTLQVDKSLTLYLHAEGFYIAIETNGTRPMPPYIDWVCVSPKANAPLHPHCTEGNELKVVFPQPALDIDRLADLKFDHHWISPMDGPDLADNTQAALDYVLKDPRWRLSIQTHKVIGAR